ncbi:beta-phosphoglucomutase [Mycoplasmopsis glycophila]|uniref:Beta-phosphoglucomutase (Beta-PGM) domain-containing protein n=1 Tax=Mycoplasmopsis glycophila TaxID=171285 RepID=A0A449AWI7_9BACT|nr:beta-phosphoglucomutase [Mycoplasmopsis glycophila]VEU71074.1 beta-phosphoglucomutase (beta-PGM) domain-containing protein [Mycoplasmopsis glycophila]
MLKGFVFDLDGVITDTAILHYQSWKQMVAKLGIDYTEADNEKLRGLPRKDTLIAILKLYNYDYSELDLDHICEEKNELYKKLLTTEINENSILPGVKNFLDQAKSHGIKLAIASSSFNAPVILEKLKIKDYFDFIVNPGTVKHGKPAPDIFIAAAHGLGLDVSECIGFEDAIAGVKGIKDANMVAVAITNEDPSEFAIADLILKSTSELDYDKVAHLVK